MMTQDDSPLSLSVLDIFKVGVGPSSSHTMGPMNAAHRFALDLLERGLLTQTGKVAVQLYGSLALTGRGHCTDRAVQLGLEGFDPATLDPLAMEPVLARIRETRELHLLGQQVVPFDEALDLLFHRDQVLPHHANGMRFSAFDAAGALLCREEFYSTGGGFIVRASEFGRSGAESAPVVLTHAFTNGASLLERCRATGLDLHELVLANETAFRPVTETRSRLLQLWSVMQACAERGFNAQGLLPGVLKVRRRAPKLHRMLSEAANPGPMEAMDWVNAWALAVNEENAAGGRVVTAPTNGAAGIIPAVLMYYRRFESGSSEEGVLRFLLAAGAIGMLYKRNASLSGAEMGCQGEVGVACSMAAAGLVAAVAFIFNWPRAPRTSRLPGKWRNTLVPFITR